MNTVITDEINVRSVEEGKTKRYIVKGTALMSNKQDIYAYRRGKDGKVRTLKSIFTPHCLESIKEQSKHKKFFVDIQHQLGHIANIKAMLKDKLTQEELERVITRLKRTEIPIAKPVNIELLEDRLDVTAELNPMFRVVDEEHKNYFDAVWYSLENKYLNGISIVFGDFKYGTNEAGDMVIDDADVLGYSFVDSPADPSNSIYEVTMRSMEGWLNQREVNKMETDKIDEEKAKLEQEKQKYLKDKEEVAKLRGEIEKEKKELEIEKQKAEQRKIEEDLLKKTEELKRVQEEKEVLKKEMTSIKGLAKPDVDKYSESGKKVYDEKFFVDKLDEITAEHRKTMEILNSGKKPLQDNTFKGFAELVQLQSKIGDITIAMDERDARYIKENRLLDIQPTDIVTPSLRRR